MHLKFLRACLSVLLSLFIFPLLQASALAQAGDESETPVIAIVNGEKLILSDLEVARSMLPQHYQKMPLEVVYPALLDQVVDSKLIEAEGRKHDFSEDPEVLERMKRVEDRVIQQVYLTRYVSRKLTEEALRAHYAELLKNSEGREEVRARHILVADEDTAREIIRELEDGADFIQLAQEKSTGPTAPEGGDLGYFLQDQMVPEFAAAAFALEPGTVRKTPVKTSFGWHVIKVVDRRSAAAPSFEDSLVEIETSLSQQIIGDLIAQLRGDAEIELFTIDGKPLVPGAPGQGNAGAAP